MRKQVVCLFLALVLALPLVLASCSGATELVDTAAPVYTLYCITGDTTTDRAITEVEYELNRTLFYRIGSIVKLVMVSADEYHELIEAKTVEVSDYINGTNIGGNNESEEKKSLVNTAKLTDSAIAAGYTAMSGEAILNDLENGIEIELECPRLDLFLVTDYASYLKLAENGDLAALDTVLSNEAKAIKSYVHSSFFNAAKVGNKTYGVPCNTIIGEYTYIVFNKDVLEVSGVAQETLYSLEDLSEYLALVKEKNPGVVPLANTVTPSTFSYMFEDGFAAYVNASGYVRNTYTDETVNKYLTMLARYSALGYFVNDAGQTGADEGVAFAVKFLSGTKEQMELLAAENNYVYNQYSVPIATSENSIDSIYCVSTLCPSSWQTDVMEILTELYTDADLQNTFLYGVENEHYRLESNQVVHINSDYIMNYAYTGNCFIAYTDADAGDSIDKWTDARNQNIDAVESKTIGFTFEPQEFVFGTTLDEDGQEVEWMLSEPDYESILWNIIQPHYQKLITGTAIDFDYQTASEEAQRAAEESIYNDLLATYVLRLERTYTSGLEAEVTEAYEEQFRAAALETVKQDLVDDFGTSSRKKKLKEQLQSENADASEEEIEALLEQVLNDPDTLWENYRTLVRKDSQWQDAIEATYVSLIDDKVTERTQEVLNSSAYLSALKAIPDSAQFIEEYNYSLEVEVADTVSTNLDNALSALITEYCNAIIEECEEALKEAIEAFAEEYSAAMQKLFEQGVYDQLKQLFPTETEEQLTARTQQMLEFIANHANDTDIQLDSALKTQINQDFPGLSEDDLKEKLSDATTIFEEVYLPLYSDAYNGANLALYEIGFASKDILKVFGTSTETETSEDTSDTTEPEDPDDDTPVAGEFETYYEFVFTVKFQTPYYAQFGTPS